jgi:hypothetical protein
LADPPYFNQLQDNPKFPKMITVKVGHGKELIKQYPGEEYERLKALEQAIIQLQQRVKDLEWRLEDSER